MEIDTGEIQALRAEVSNSQRRGAYFYLILVLTMVLGAGAAIWVSVKLSQRSAAEQQETQRRQGEQTRLATCLVITTQQAIYRDPTVPGSPARAKALDAWNQLSQLLNCN